MKLWLWAMFLPWPLDHASIGIETGTGLYKKHENGDKEESELMGASEKKKRLGPVQVFSLPF